MMLSDKRLEKELAAQKYRAEKLAKEALAQQKKAEAIAHLESQGQRVEGVVGFSKKLEAKTSDNTLALLLGRKAVSIANEGEKIKEQNAKVALIKQQEESRRSRELKNENENLPHPWTSVFDQNSKSYYYWNSITNETTWEKPRTIICDSAAPIIEDTVQSVVIPPNQMILTESTPTLLLGWEERVHPATQQKYYINPTTGERRSEAPTIEALTAKQISTFQVAAPEAKKRPSSSSSDEFSKFQRYAIDPLDYEAVQGNKRGGRTSDKMADSTASGPLWQQRPYPAPGTILRTKEMAGSSVGPSRGPETQSESSAVRAPYVRGSYPNNKKSTTTSASYRAAPGHYGPAR